ncbi:hypothetical protein CYMTET_46800 [Cymbomonas tetramitiformis]|uniref:Uncharacterized protein n=1 Tax=Cymbomonas tetramitiformis TaxID=36881 RepID=A0AAE0BVJ7_9CHLO|nr:hypothetical protein CYMTET_46800 [Cymbomonas tetramitiformis]
MHSEGDVTLAKEVLETDDPAVAIDDMDAVDEEIVAPNLVLPTANTSDSDGTHRRWKRNGKWISPAKHAEVAIVYYRYSQGDVTLAKEVLERHDLLYGTHTEGLTREGRPGADDEWVVRQTDSELKRKRDSELVDCELQERKRQQERLDEEHDVKMQERRLQLQDHKTKMQERSEEHQRQQERLDEDHKTNLQDRSEERKLQLQERSEDHKTKMQERKITFERDLKIKNSLDIKSMLESCLELPGLSEAERGVYRAHIHNMVTNLVKLATGVDASSALPAIAAPPPAPPAPPAPAVNVTVNNSPTNNPSVTTTNNNTNTNENEAVPAANADGAREVTPEERRWLELWHKRGTPENADLTIADFLADPSEPEHARYSEMLKSKPGIVNTFGRRLAKTWRKTHGVQNIPEQVGTVQNVQTGFHAPGCKRYFEADRPLMRSVAVGLLSTRKVGGNTRQVAQYFNADREIMQRILEGLRL